MLNPDHLLELASDLASAQGAGAPRQVILRRAVSTAYYAVFHALCGKMAETFVPAYIWKSQVLFYRSLDHGRAKERCKKLGQNPLASNERAFFGFEAFSNELREFANFVLLQELRHRCDYDPDYKISKLRVQEAIEDATQAVGQLNGAGAEERNKFLAYLLFGIRPL